MKSIGGARAPWGVVLVNTGTPDAPESGAVRHYLRRFLSDPRVIETPRWLWWPLLNGVILPLRAPRSAAKYRSIWRDDGSPLRVYGERLGEALARALHDAVGAVRVEVANLYSQPGVAEAFAAHSAAGVRRIIVMPLYPQASGTTTGAVYDQAGEAMRGVRTFPDLRFMGDYHDRPAYIDALATSVRDHWREQGRGAHLLISFHGIPLSCVQAGDAYGAQCQATAEALAAALGLDAADWTLAFQSRFGPARWLTPATATVLHDLPRRGVRSLDVVCPGFAVDCLETLEEIAIEGRETFVHAGGERFSYVPALNARPIHARALAALLLDATRDWH